MRVPINLASQPFENLRPVRTSIMAALVVVLVLSVIILRRELHSRAEFGALIQQQTAVEDNMRDLAAERAELEGWLATPQALDIRERSAFLNSLILRKGLSWTQLFMDLEKTLPEQAQITAIHPSLSPTEDVDLTLTVSAARLEPLVAFLKNLETSPVFGPPAVDSQHYKEDKSSTGTVSLSLTTRYVQRRETPAAEIAEPEEATAENHVAHSVAAPEEEAR